MSSELYISRENTDSILYGVITKMKSRGDIGKEKYGKTLDRTDLSYLDWLNHAQEEAMDMILYLEKLKQYHTEGSRIQESVKRNMYPFPHCPPPPPQPCPPPPIGERPRECLQIHTPRTPTKDTNLIFNLETIPDDSAFLDNSHIRPEDNMV